MNNLSKQQLKNRMNLNLTMIVIGACLIYLITNVALPPLVTMYNDTVKTNADTAAIVADAQLKRAAAEKERADAQLKEAQAAQIQQEMRFNDEHNNGTAVNVQARIEQGKGITAWEQQQTEQMNQRNALITIGAIVLVVIALAIILH